VEGGFERHGPAFALGKKKKTTRLPIVTRLPSPNNNGRRRKSPEKGGIGSRARGGPRERLLTGKSKRQLSREKRVMGGYWRSRSSKGQEGDLFLDSGGRGTSYHRGTRTGEGQEGVPFFLAGRKKVR